MTSQGVLQPVVLRGGGKTRNEEMGMEIWKFGNGETGTGLAEPRGQALHTQSAVTNTSDSTARRRSWLGL